MDIPRLVAELKGRGVYRVAALYAAGSWALLQVADLFFPIVGLPDWAITTVLAAAALGFPVAITLAWIFEITPDGLVETDATGANFGRLQLSPARLLELTLLITLIGLVGYLYLERLALQEQVAKATTALGDDDRPSVAVMAFDNLSTDPDIRYFGDGLAEEILNLLSRISELNVAARTSSFYYQDKDIDLREVGSRLGVDHVLEGGVRRSGDRVRVTAQLIDLETGYSVWSATYDRDYSDSFLIQNDIARQVVGNMRVILSEDSQGILRDRPIVDPQAYDYYLRGREYLRQPAGSANLDTAIALFQKAIALDSDYAEAHAGLCDAQLALYSNELDPQQFRQAEVSCEAALALEAQALPVYVALGNLYRISGQHEQAELQLLKALEIHPRAVSALEALALNLQASNRDEQAEAVLKDAIRAQPNNWHSYLLMGNFLFESGRFAEAVTYFRRLTELTPDNADALNNLGVALSLLSDFEAAADAFERSLKLSPTAAAYANAGSSLFFAGRFEAAAGMYLRAVELAPRDFEHWGNLGDAYRHADNSRERALPMFRNAIRLSAEHLQINPSDAITLSLVAHYHAALGAREEALQYRARATALAPDDVYVHYYSALALSSLGEQDRALASLRRAIELGYSLDLVYADAGLATLRSHAEFGDIVALTAPVGN